MKLIVYVLYYNPELEYNLSLAGCIILLSSTVKNLGILLDSNLLFKAYPCFQFIQSHAFMTSRLDYCNVLLNGCPTGLLKMKVQQLECLLEQLNMIIYVRFYCHYIHFRNSATYL